jgi:hypothetical protein
MKKWIFAVALCGVSGCSLQQEPGQPMRFAPAPPAAAPAPSAERSAPSADPVAAEPESDSHEALEADNAQTGGADAPADRVTDDNRKDAADLDQSVKGTAPPAAAEITKGASDAATICDSACKKACVNAADKNVCAKAYAAGCFSGTAPATFDCGTREEKRKIKDDGVEERGMPVITP